MELTGSVFWTFIICCELIGLSSGSGGTQEGFPATEYCIVGAGPAGVQLGHFFFEADRSYRIFEKASKAGSFFAEDGRGLPIHRNLISINKRTTGKSDPEYNMRFDWNSLLGDHVPRVTNRTRRLWPDAQIIADYVHDFVGIQVDAGKVAFNTEVRKISCLEGWFHLETSGGSARCEVVIVASGLQTARQMPENEHLVHGYETLTKNMEQFDAKEVAVLGAGNAAFETAEALQDFARITILHRSKSLPWKVKPRLRDSDRTANFVDNAQGTRFAMHTHYVGDVRAARLGIFDSYQLKMADRVYRQDPNLEFLVIRCMGDRRCIFSVPKKKMKNKKYKLLVEVQLSKAMLDKTNAALLKYTKKHLDVKDSDIELRMIVGPTAKECKQMPCSRFKTKGYTMSIRRSVLESDQDFFPFLLRETNISAFNLETGGVDLLVVDDVIRCYGWKMDKSMFDDQTVAKHLQMSHNDKYPVINGKYEAPGVPGLFFAGSLAHSLDFQKSAGGFIHGFRYSARALFRYFEETRAGVSWPGQKFDIRSKRGIKGLVDLLLYRFNVAAGPYQMFGGTLLDGVIFSNSSLEATCDVATKDGSCSSSDEQSNSGMMATFYEEMPPAYFEERFSQYFRLVWYFEYGKGFYGPSVLDSDSSGAGLPYWAQKSTFLHPRLRLRRPGGDVHDVVLQHWVLEEVTFSFSKFWDHEAPLTRFIETVIEHINHGV